MTGPAPEVEVLRSVRDELRHHHAATLDPIEDILIAALDRLAEEAIAWGADERHDFYTDAAAGDRADRDRTRTRHQHRSAKDRRRLVIVLGIDPGINGGLAIVDITNTSIVIGAIDVPIIGTGAKERVDAIAIRKWIEQHRPALAFIERAQARPKQGASSTFKYARAVGAIEAAITLSGIPVQIVEPSVWKRGFHLPGKDKEAARQRALELFPHAQCTARAQTRSRSRRSNPDRALRNSQFPRHRGATRGAARFNQHPPIQETTT